MSSTDVDDEYQGWQSEETFLKRNHIDQYQRKPGS